MDKADFIAKIAHQCWCGYQLGAGQEFNLDPTNEQHKSQVNGVEEWLKNPSMTAEENHENWMDYKLSIGWTWGKVKDEKKKTHPDLIPYHELPEVERAKDDMDIEARRFALELWDQLSFEDIFIDRLVESHSTHFDEDMNEP